MFEIKGKYGTAKVFIDELEQSATSQIYSLLNHPISENAKIRIMPDAHAGAGCVIGYTSTLTDKVVCNLVGVDIGCGVTAWKLNKKKEEIDFSVFDNLVRHVIPSGRNVRNDAYKAYDTFNIMPNAKLFETCFDRIAKICAKQNQDHGRVLKSIGTLGGGNHFIEIDEDDNGYCWLVVHSGSRNFGLKIANWHQKIANKRHGDKMGGLAWLEGEDKDNYLEDMKVAQNYAHLNRKVIGELLIKEYFNFYTTEIESVHNYIDFDDKIIRKGAISANEYEKVIIPLNMADGVIIGTGKGNQDWNNSAPHGAGRTMSRTVAKEKVSLEDFRKRMDEAGVWSTCIHKSTIDESPMAYKKPEHIIEYLKETVDIETQMKPIYNFKSGN
tara:strand:+ start:1417 stop:2565 length:1149 start_codon:yes stop_codon:yes gene_type:complete